MTAPAASSAIRPLTAFAVALFAGPLTASAFQVARPFNRAVAPPRLVLFESKQPGYLESLSEDEKGSTPADTTSTPEDVTLTPEDATAAADAAEAFVEEANKSLSGGALVPINESTVEFTAGILGLAAGLLLGGPFVGLVGAAGLNYASKRTDNDFSEAVYSLSKRAIEAYNYIVKMDATYGASEKTKKTVGSTLDTIIEKTGAVDPETKEKIESSIGNTSNKVKELAKEYDVQNAVLVALGAAGDLVERAVSKAGQLNEEYKVGEQVGGAVKEAVKEAKEKVPNVDMKKIQEDVLGPKS